MNRLNYGRWKSGDIAPARRPPDDGHTVAERAEMKRQARQAEREDARALGLGSGWVGRGLGDD